MAKLVAHHLDVFLLILLSLSVLAAVAVEGIDQVISSASPPAAAPSPDPEVFEDLSPGYSSEAPYPQTEYESLSPPAYPPGGSLDSQPSPSPQPDLYEYSPAPSPGAPEDSAEDDVVSHRHAPSTSSSLPSESSEGGEDEAAAYSQQWNQKQAEGGQDDAKEGRGAGVVAGVVMGVSVVGLGGFAYIMKKRRANDVRRSYINLSKRDGI